MKRRLTEMLWIINKKKPHKIYTEHQRERIIPRFNNRFIISSHPILGQACLCSENSFHSLESWSLMFWKPPFKIM